MLEYGTSKSLEVEVKKMALMRFDVKRLFANKFWQLSEAAYVREFSKTQTEVSSYNPFISLMILSLC